MASSTAAKLLRCFPDSTCHLRPDCKPLRFGIRNRTQQVGFLFRDRVPQGSATEAEVRVGLSRRFLGCRWKRGIERLCTSTVVASPRGGGMQWAKIGRAHV